MFAQTVFGEFYLILYELLVIECFRFTISFLTKYDVNVVLLTLMTKLYSVNFFPPVDLPTNY